MHLLLTKRTTSSRSTTLPTTAYLRTVAALLATPFFLGTAQPVLAQASNQSATVTNSALTNAPRLRFANRLLQGTLGKTYDGALDNLLRINTIADKDGKRNPTGLMATPPGTFVRAGGGYEEPWTRDASLNSWNAASLLEPVEARNTLWAVCQKQADGSIVLQRDNQWWDKVIWITGAWSHYRVTGDEQFLKAAYAVTQDELALMRKEHFNTHYGLFQGPAFFSDGIAGYPEPEFDPANNSSFVLDHHYTHELMVLSTNCAYYNAYRCAALMARQLGHPESEVEEYAKEGEYLKTAINKYLWNAEKGTYGYYMRGAGPRIGTRDETQEGIGLSFAILFGVADDKKAQSILKTAHRSPYGMTTQWPHFARYSDALPGRHNVIVWPLVNGMWATAAAQTGDVEMFRDEVENLALLTMGSNGHFFEIYNSLDGKPDGGWQSGWHWPSQPDQTWSATAYLRMMYQGLFGMNFQPKGLSLSPKLPASWGPVDLQGVRYRDMTLDVSLEGQGTRIAKVLLDGKATDKAFLPATLTGKHTLVVTMKE